MVACMEEGAREDRQSREGDYPSCPEDETRQAEPNKKGGDPCEEEPAGVRGSGGAFELNHLTK